VEGVGAHPNGARALKRVAVAVRDLEEALIRTLRPLELEATRLEGLILEERIHLLAYALLEGLSWSSSPP
jgi:hypothetical protein